VSQNDNEILTATGESEEKKMSSDNKIDIALTARMNGAHRIDISGPTGPFPLAKDTGAWLFNFTLDDGTGKGVKFTTLDAEDDSNSCPPGATGNQSRLIVGEHVDPTNPRKARFTDNNNNRAADGVVNVTFQWHFACDDPEITHIDTYDPVVPNGGNT
jgi:hypothetical protein